MPSFITISAVHEDVRIAAFAATNCTEDVINFVPSCIDLINILGTNGWILLGLATTAFLTVVILFVANLAYTLRKIHSKYTFSTSLVLTVYPVLALCMYLEILFPKANNVLDATAQLWFALCMYHYFRLTISYFGGETAFVVNLSGKVLPWRNLPCCFWPCIWPCLPKDPISKKQIRFLRIMIIQHPFVQAIFTIIGLTFYIEDWFVPKQISLTNAYIYLYIITTLSFFFAVWAFIVCIKAARLRLKNFKYCGKFASFQLTLVFLRLQNLLFNMLLIPTGIMPCIPPLSPKILANTILSSLLLGELVILSVMANHFYRSSKGDRKDFLVPVRHASKGSQCNLLSSDESTSTEDSKSSYNSILP